MNTIQHKYSIGDTVYYVSTNYNRQNIEIVAAKVTRVMYGVKPFIRVVKDGNVGNPTLEYTLSDYMTVAEAFLYSSPEEAKEKFNERLQEAIIVERKNDSLDDEHES